MPLPRFGNAAITWTATSETNSERVHLLEAPLREIRSGHKRQNWFRESMDQSNIEHVVLSSAGAYELVGRVRYDRNPQSLQDLLIAGSGGKPLKYYPDLKDSDVSFSCDLIAPLSPNSVQMDPQRGAMGDHSVELVLRKTDQSPLEPLWYGTEVLFWYEAGDDLDARGSTFSRTTSTSAPASYAALPAFGTLSTAKTNEARISWESTASSQGPRDFQTLLLEAAATNLVTESEDFGQWTDTTSIASSSGQSDPYGTTEAWRIFNLSTSLGGYEKLSITLSTAAAHAVSVFLKEGTTASPSGTSVKLHDATAAEDRCKFTVTWSSGEPVVTVNTGTTARRNTERWRGAWWRIFAQTTTTISTGNSNELRITPVDVDTETGDVYASGVQVE